MQSLRGWIWLLVRIEIPCLLLNPALSPPCSHRVNDAHTSHYLEFVELPDYFTKFGCVCPYCLPIDIALCSCLPPMPFGLIRPDKKRGRWVFLLGLGLLRGNGNFNNKFRSLVFRNIFTLAKNILSTALSVMARRWSGLHFLVNGVLVYSPASVISNPETQINSVT